MGLPQLSTLIGIAGGCGVAVGCMALLMLRERDKLTNQAPFVTKAVDLLKQQSVTKELLGEELKVGKATISDGPNKLGKFDVKVRVPIKGDKDEAFLYAYAWRPDEKEKLRLYKLEATFGKVVGKKLILMDRTNLIEEAEKEAKKKEELSKKKLDEGLSPEEKKQLFIEQMKTWHPQR